MGEAMGLTMCIRLAVALTVGLGALGAAHVPVVNAEERQEGKFSCEGEASVAIKSTFGTKLALGSRMLFRPRSVKNIDIIRAAEDCSSGQRQGVTKWYAIVKVGQPSRWKDQVYRAYEIDGKKCSDAISYMEQDGCVVDFIGTTDESGFNLDDTKITEFIVERKQK